jgi:EAL domain-containing protein (putative c-di-GMP-specific phosphodiesterase class I)
MRRSFVRENRAEVLFVDGDDVVSRALSESLESDGIFVRVMSSESGLALLRDGWRFDAIVTDLTTPGTNGAEFMRSIRALDPDVPVIVLTEDPGIEVASSAVTHGAFRCVSKPSKLRTLASAVREAAALHRFVRIKRSAFEQRAAWQLDDCGELGARFERALSGIFIAFQPIIAWPERTVFGHEALVRSSEALLSEPGMLFEAAERLGRVVELGRKIRAEVAKEAEQAPESSTLFINLHATDLADDDLYYANAPLSRHAERVVLEITERSSLQRVTDVPERIAMLRRLGYRVAVDDLGAGYAGRSSFGLLEPDVVKLDMALVRSIESSATRASIVRSMISVCTEELGTELVCEGVETAAERDVLHDLGARLLQGYLFAKPARGFRTTSIFAPPIN